MRSFKRIDFQTLLNSTLLQTTLTFNRLKKRYIILNSMKSKYLSWVCGGDETTCSHRYGVWICEWWNIMSWSILLLCAFFWFLQKFHYLLRIFFYPIPSKQQINQPENKDPNNQNDYSSEYFFSSNLPYLTIKNSLYYQK